MHEVFLTRGDVQGAPVEIQQKIHCAANCVILHPACHPHAGGEVEKLKWAAQILAAECMVESPPGALSKNRD